MLYPPLHRVLQLYSILFNIGEYLRNVCYCLFPLGFCLSLGPVLLLSAFFHIFSWNISATGTGDEAITCMSFTVCRELKVDSSSLFMNNSAIHLANTQNQQGWCVKTCRLAQIIITLKFMHNLVGQNVPKDRARLRLLWRWNLNIIRVMQNVCVAVTGDSHSWWDKAFGTVQQCGRAVESEEVHETLGTLKTQGILPSKLAQTASRNGESSCTSLGDYLGNSNMRHIPLKLTMITRVAYLYYHFPLIVDFSHCLQWKCHINKWISH